MQCPKCGYLQFCPCKSCLPRLPDGWKPWVNKENDVIECAKCGFEAHIDWWESEEIKQYEEGKV